MAERRVTFIVGANIRNFQKGMQSVSNRFRSLQRNLQRTGRRMTQMITGPLAAMGGGLLAIQKRTGDYADKLLDLSQITGISTDALQEWRNVARVAGVDTNALTNAAEGLSRRIRGINDESGAAFNAAEQLGISFRDANGNMRETDAIMTDAIASLSDMAPGLERASLAGDLFGRRWEQIAPILGMTSAEIDHARQQAHDLGLVMDGDALNAANQFRQEFELLRERLTAAGRSLATDLLPLVRNEFIPMAEAAFERVREWAQAFSSLDTESQKNIATFAALAAAAGPAILVLSQFAGVVAALLSPLALKTGALLAVVGSLVYLGKNFEAIGARIKREIQSWALAAQNFASLFEKTVLRIASLAPGLAGNIASVSHEAFVMQQGLQSIDEMKPLQTFGEFFGSVKNDLVAGLGELTSRFLSFSRDSSQALQGVQDAADSRITFDAGISGVEAPDVNLTDPWENLLEGVEGPARGVADIIGDLRDEMERMAQESRMVEAEVSAAFWDMYNSGQASFGSLAFGPTLAVVGDNPNAATDPEVIAPLSKLERMQDFTRIGSRSAGMGRGSEQTIKIFLDGRQLEHAIEERRFRRGR